MTAVSSRSRPVPPKHTRNLDKVLPIPALLVFALAIGCGAGGSNGGGNGEGAQATQDRTSPGPTGTTQPGQDRSSAVPTRAEMPPTGTAWVIFGADTVRAEVASTAEQRQRGLMYRDQVPDGTGMLFVFQDVQPRSFWMQNTYVALDIAFLDAELRVVDIQQMEPRTEDFHDSRAPAMYALEVRKGWLAEHGIRIGDQARLITGG